VRRCIFLLLSIDASLWQETANDRLFTVRVCDMLMRALACTFRQQIADIEPPITWAILGIIVFGTSVIIFNQFANNIDWCVQHDDRCRPFDLILMLIGCSADVLPQQLAGFDFANAASMHGCATPAHTRTQVLHAHCRHPHILHGDGGLPRQGRDRLFADGRHGQDSAACDWRDESRKRSIEYSRRRRDGRLRCMLVTDSADNNWLRHGGDGMPCFAPERALPHGEVPAR
jgi:hypothetical protein